MDPAKNLALSELLQLWSKRADCIHAVDMATAEFRRAVVRAGEAGVSLKHMARVMGVTPRAVRQHRDAGQAAQAATPAEAVCEG